MDHIDVEKLDVVLEAEQARIASILREAADRVERLQAIQLCDVLPAIVGRVDRLAQELWCWID